MLTQRLQESHQNSSLLVTFFDLFCCFCFMITMGNCEFCLSWITFPPSFSSSSSMRSTKETVWSQNVFQDELSLPLKLLSILWLFPGESLSPSLRKGISSPFQHPHHQTLTSPPQKKIQLGRAVAALTSSSVHQYPLQLVRTQGSTENSLREVSSTERWRKQEESRSESGEQTAIK